MKFTRATLLWLTTLVTPACFAGFPTPFFTIHCDGVGFVRVDDGKLSIGANSLNKVPDRQAAPDKWYVGGTQIKSSVGGGYLAYDVSGKDPRVFLTKGNGGAAEWEVVIHRGRKENATVRAAKGPYKGWSLRVQDKALILSPKESTVVWVDRFYEEHK